MKRGINADKASIADVLGNSMEPRVRTEGVNVMENMSLIKDLVLVFAAMITAGSAAVTACAAHKGINKWLVELRGRTNFEVAHGLMLATYKLRDAVRSCRSPLVTPAEEFPDNYPPNLEATHAQELEAWVYVFKNRWAPVWEACQDYNARSLEAEALWGSQVRKSTDELSVLIKNLHLSIATYLEGKHYQEESLLANKTFEKEIRSIVFATKPDDNELSKSIDKVVEEVERKVEPYLGRG